MYLFVIFLHHRPSSLALHYHPAHPPSTSAAGKLHPSSTFAAGKLYTPSTSAAGSYHLSSTPAAEHHWKFVEDGMSMFPDTFVIEESKMTKNLRFAVQSKLPLNKQQSCALLDFLYESVIEYTL